MPTVTQQTADRLARICKDGEELAMDMGSGAVGRVVANKRMKELRAQIDALIERLGAV